MNNLMEKAKIECIKNPELFSNNFLGTTKKTNYQKEAFEIILNQSNHRIAIGSSNAMGKTHLIAESILALYFL